MISALMISVSSSVPPVSVHQCPLSVSISAPCQCPSMPPASAHQCHINATYQCLPVHINATYKCSSECQLSIASQCHLSMLPISAIY
ncbi:unnamed protein product [Staurois parvus]|uniref:Uncharacterized protein n=1 Tax=Staurois parvus TaxID=386267 RepID=A0ABN9FD57_9NEOB|nr:unnamed protein product [Staurois parvus]